MTHDSNGSERPGEPGRQQAAPAAVRTEHAPHVPIATETGAPSATHNPGGTPPPPTAPTRSKPGMRRRGIAALLAAGVLAAGAAFLFAPASDSVSDQQKQQRIEEFARAGTIQTQRVPAAEIGAALAAMPLAAPDKARLQAQVDSGSVRLVYLTLWDNQAEDDDRVRIDSATFSFEVALKKNPTRIAVPEPPSGVLNVVGTRDGGGGITVAMLSGSATVQLPVMAVGQWLGVPVASAP